jgi:hypothetical protein
VVIYYYLQCYSFYSAASLNDNSLIVKSITGMDLSLNVNTGCFTWMEDQQTLTVSVLMTLSDKCVWPMSKC